MTNLNKKFVTFTLATLLFGMTQFSKASEITCKNLQQTTFFLGKEVVNDVTNILTKNGTICRIIQLGGYVWAADMLTDFIHDNIVNMSVQTKKLVRVGLLTTAYIGYKLKNLSKVNK